MNTAFVSSDAAQYSAHDLVRLRALPATEDMPSWTPAAFAQAPFAVVRRAQAPAGFVAVGFRGAARGQRYGTFVALGLVEAALSPEHLPARPVSPERSKLKVFAALRAFDDESRFRSLIWGPTGSVGFELATRQPSATDSSDLDILIRTPAPLSREHARTVCEQVVGIERTVGVRIDVQLETPAGGIALSEWAQGKARVMVRSAHGPSMSADPWANARPFHEAPR